MKICNVCNIEKSSSEFSRHPATKDKLQPRCRICDSNRWKTKKGVIKRRYSSQKINSKERGYSPPSYSFKEFYNWAIVNEDFMNLYENWKNSGFLKNLAPSFDRLDDYKGYSFDNIRVVTWNENVKKSWKDRKTGVNTKHSVSVVQINVENKKEINTFNSVRLAGRKLGLCSSSISKCCKGKQKTCGGFIWKYKLV